MKRYLLIAALTLSQLACGVQPDEKPAVRKDQLKTLVDQGPNWYRDTRAQFYTEDQGSRIIPLRWLAALRQADGQRFLADSLSRYGYLENKEDAATKLPAGFTTNGPTGNESVGMNCAACHTREIIVKSQAYRIDGGPALADFQTMLTDLDAAVYRTLSTQKAFRAFVADVLEEKATGATIKQLRKDLQAWYLPYHAFMTRALPTARNGSQPWGHGRLDAIGMIFDRLTGLDIGPDLGKTKELHWIPGNIRPANAPARYPFLWNAAIQDKTQWPGFAGNGNDLLALARNTGEVIGVFADFRPVLEPNRPLGVDYSTQNSANTTGLMTLEDLIKKIGPPKFAWANEVNAALATQGADIFGWPASKGGCAECHGIFPGKDALTGKPVWITPVMDVGTDSLEYRYIPLNDKDQKWMVDTGVLNGQGIPVLSKRLKAREPAFSVLSLAVTGTILQRLKTVARFEAANDEGSNPESLSPNTSHKRADSLMTAFAPPEASGGTFKYESRVLQGIWAAAPYLHNGSVPTLADLLELPENRPAKFDIGANYDPFGKIGLAQDQSDVPHSTVTTGCANPAKDRNSGNSNCGHTFGYQLTAEQKKALLEYLKML